MPLMDLPSALMLVSLLLFVLSLVTLLWVTWRHHRLGKQTQTNFHARLSVEMAWTLVPAVMVLVLVWPIAQAFWSR